MEADKYFQKKYNIIYGFFILIICIIALEINISKNVSTDVVKKDFNYRANTVISSGDKAEIKIQKVDFLKQMMSVNLLKDYRIAIGLDIKEEVFVTSGDFEEIINISGDKDAENIIIEEQPQVPEGAPTNYVKYIDCEATAYCLCKKCTGKTPGSAGYGRTASGLVIVPGTNMKVCAVSRSQIPLGTHSYVQGWNGAKDYGYAIAADTGGAIKNNRIDLYMDSHSDCLKWGRRKVRVYILPEDKTNG